MSFELTTTKAFQIFHILRQLSIIFTAILLAKIGVSQSEIGNYELLLFILYAVSFFWVSGFTQGLLSLYPRKNGTEQKQLVFQLFLLFSALAAIAALVLLFGQSSLLPLLTGSATPDYLLLFLIYLFFNLPTYLIEHIYLLESRPLPIVWFAVLSFGTHIFVVLLPILLGYGFQGSFIGLIGLAIIKYIWLIILLLQYSAIHFNFSLLIELTRFSFPLVLYALLGGFAQVFDSWLVNWTYDGDVAQFAIFRYGARELPLALAVASAFGSSMLPIASKSVETALPAIREKSGVLLHLFFPLSILAAFYSKELYTIIFNEAFQESYAIFNIYLLILISRLFFPHTILIALNQNTFIFKVSVVELAINIVSSVILVQYFGLVGIALGTVIAYTFEKIVYLFYLKRKFNIAAKQYSQFGWLALYSSILILTVVWSVFAI